MLESTRRAALGDLVAMVERHPHVSLLLTCRDDNTATAPDAFFGRGHLDCRTIRMPALNREDILRVTKAVPALSALLSRPEPEQIMTTPYVLDMAARMAWPDPQDIPPTMRAFRERWWSEVVRGDGKNPVGPAHLREQTLLGLAMRRARRMRPLATTGNLDPGTLHRLHGC